MSGRHIRLLGLLSLMLWPAGEANPTPADSQAVAVCREVVPLLVACPDAAALEDWALTHHLREPAEAEAAADLEPADPLPIRDGLEVYETFLAGPARYTRTALELWENTPPFGAAELEYFRAHPEIWEARVAIHAEPSGAARERRLRGALAALGDDREAARHLLLRNGLLYFEERQTAVWVVRHLRLGDLFDAPRIELWRGTDRFLLERDERGDYRHTEPAFEGYRARLHLLDRIGEPGTLEPLPSYDLAGLRAELGLDYLEVGAEEDGGRAGTAVFLSGDRLPARLVRLGAGDRRLGVVAEVEALSEVLRRSEHQAKAIDGVLQAAYAMVREELFFDEPPNEVGQQDGIMRPLFEKGVERGQRSYVVNGVRVDAYDERGRALPPQVCVDFLTDAVERFAGRWWPRAETGGGATAGRIDIRRYMPERRVEDLLALAEARPHAAELFRFPPADHVPYRDSAAFFDNLWRYRDEIRRGDVIVIFGLRPDMRNHYHSFYISNTDPIHGVPIEITDNAGVARTRSWHEVMSGSPRRSLRYRVRWGADWLMQPAAVDAADAVAAAARRAAESMPAEPLIGAR